MTGAPSLILIGIDGGTFDLIDPWVSAGRLPAIASLLRGVRGEPVSTHPPLTPVAWSSLLSGCDPGMHGVWGFLEMAADHAPNFLNGGALELPTLFELLSAAGVRVGTINLPWTWPPRAVNGWWLSGPDAPAFSEEMAYPRRLYHEVCERFDGYFDRSVAPQRSGYALDRLEETVAKTGAIARYLAQAHPVDLLAVAFVSTDHVQHWFWQERSVVARDGRRVDDLLLHTWELVDREIGRFIEDTAGPRTTVMLVSDHGAGPTEGGINLARWLAEEGWLRERSVGARGRMRSACLRLGRRMLPEALRERLRGRYAGTRRAMLSHLLRDAIDWPGTTAFCWSDYGSISLNIEGRFDAGCVSEDARDGLLVEIREALAELRHPETGERVLSAPLEPRDTYFVRHERRAPDLLVVPRDYRWEILSDFTPYGPVGAARGVFGPALRQATHRLRGIFAADGPELRRGVSLCGGRIEDIAPTVLHLLGQPVPSYMTGRVLSEALEPHRLAARPPRREEVDPQLSPSKSGYSRAQAAAVERDLHGMGYI